MIDWEDGYAVGEALTLEDVTGFIFGEMDPSVTEPGIGIPQSVLFIRTNPPEVWQKQSGTDLDWIKLGDGTSVIQVPELYLPFCMADGSEIRLPLATNMKLPFLMSDGSEIHLQLEV